MHAYAHQWACQVVYAPRMRKGMGLTDGEGIERLWSRIRRLIPITRNASVGFSCFVAELVGLSIPIYRLAVDYGSLTEPYQQSLKIPCRGWLRP